MTLLKIVMVGDSAVGKTSLRNSYKGKFSLSPLATIGLDFCRVSVEVDGRDYDVNIYDTCGNEQVKHNMQHMNRLKPDALIVMFSVTNPRSFDSVEKKWIPGIRNFSPNIPIVIVGNMIDLVDRRWVSTKQGERLESETNTLKYMECCCKTRSGVSDVFQESVKAAKRYKAITKTRERREEAKKYNIDESCGMIAAHCGDVIDPVVVGYS